MAEISKKLYEVKVAGLSLKLRSSHDEETVGELLNLVDKKIEEAMSSNQSISFQNALLLAGLHLAEELVLLKRRAFTDLDNLEDRARRILLDIESSPISNIRLDN